MVTRRTALAGVLGLSGAVAVGRAQAADDDVLQANKDSAKRYIEAFTTGDFSVFEEIVAEDFAPSDPDDEPGRAALITRSQALAESRSSMVADLVYTIDSMTAEADRVLIRGEGTGTNEGRIIRALYFVELVFRNGQIQTGWSLLDVSAFFGE